MKKIIFTLSMLLMASNMLVKGMERFTPAEASVIKEYASTIYEIPHNIEVNRREPPLITGKTQWIYGISGNAIGMNSRREFIIITTDNEHEITEVMLRNPSGQGMLFFRKEKLSNDEKGRKLLRVLREFIRRQN